MWGARLCCTSSSLLNTCDSKFACLGFVCLMHKWFRVFFSEWVSVIAVQDGVKANARICVVCGLNQRCGDNIRSKRVCVSACLRDLTWLDDLTVRWRWCAVCCVFEFEEKQRRNACVSVCMHVSCVLCMCCVCEGRKRAGGTEMMIRWKELRFSSLSSPLFLFFSTSHSVHCLCVYPNC